jgi:type VI secretion system secreted protein Hcp
MLRSGSIRSARNRVTVLAGGTALAVTTALLLHNPSTSTAAAPTDLGGVMATVAQASTTAVSSADYFLKIDGITGESRAKGHEGQIDIESFSWGASNTGTAATGGGAGAGKVKFSDFSFSKMLDKASPLLMQAVASGKRIKTVTLYGTAAGEGNGQTYLTITLTDVLVSSFNESGSGGGGAPQDSLSLNFTKITFDYKPQNPDGSLGTAVHGGWDLKANKAA